MAQSALILLPLPWFQPVEPQKNTFKFNFFVATLQIFESSSHVLPEFLLQAKLSSFSHCSYDMTSVHATVLITFHWMGTSFSLSFSREESDIPFIPTLTHLLSQLCLADAHTLHRQQNPHVVLTRAAVKPCHPLWDLGSCVSGPKHRASNHLSPLKFRLVEFVLLFQAVWVFLGPNSLPHRWQPLPALDCPHS